MSDSSSNPLAAAAGNPPPGLSPQDRLSSYNGVPLTAALGVLAGLAFIFWSIRIYAKTIITRRIGWDDRSILSLSFKIKTYGNSDLTYDLTLANFFVYVVPPYHNDDYKVRRSNPLASAVKMSLGICIASIPLVARAFKEHRSQLSSVAESLSSPFWRFGRTFTARSTIDHKSTAIYEVDHDSASSNGLVELGMPMKTRGSM
ncbi:MAG: hypothetical protein LQ345_002364 [Seirophora villosa]|nr:MAG: hypothetical protein LQ345_002364 [Seirophora villosa]